MPFMVPCSVPNQIGGRTSGAFRAVFRSASILAALLANGAAWGEMSGAERRVLRTAAEVHQLSVEQAASSLPVSLEAVVTYYAFETPYGFFVQDDTDAVFVSTQAYHPGVRAGKQVRLSGISGAGEYAPIVRLSEYEILGDAPLPDPVPVTVDALMTGAFDSRLVELSGLVRGARSHPEQLPPHVVLMLRSAGREVTVRIDHAPADPTVWLDAAVTVRGIASGTFTAQRQMLEPLILVRSGEMVRVDQEPPAWQEIPIYSAGELFRFASAGQPTRRIRVKGTVQGHRPGEWLAALDETGGGFWVETIHDTFYPAGSVVEFAGFPELGPSGLRLTFATGRLIETTSPPPPSRSEIPVAVRRPAQLHRVSGTLIAPPRPGQNGWVLQLEEGTLAFEAVVPVAGSTHAEAWRPGAILSLVGVAEPLHAGPPGLPPPPVPLRLRLLVRNPADVVLLRPAPWYFSPRSIRNIMVGLIIAVVVAATLSILLIALVHRNRSLAEARRGLRAARDELAAKYEERTGQLREHLEARDAAEAEAALLSAERTRVARELHDTIEQGLASVALMLDATKEMMSVSPDKSLRLLETSAGQLRACQKDVRRSVWGLRALALERSNLAEALQNLAASLDATAAASFHFHCEGTPRVLQARSANGMFRIAQEALANALKHAHASVIDVGVQYEAEAVRMWISDDGTGFDPTPHDDGKQHFGLSGMKERAANLGAELEILSKQGEGTRLRVTLPLNGNGGLSV